MVIDCNYLTDYSISWNSNSVIFRSLCLLIWSEMNSFFMIKFLARMISAILFVYYSKLECCGGTGYQDWERNVIFSCSSSSTLLRCSVPSSCCTQSTGIHCGLQARLRQVNVFNDYSFSKSRKLSRSYFCWSRFLQAV